MRPMNDEDAAKIIGIIVLALILAEIISNRML